MKGKIKKYYIFGTVFTIIFGTILHFVYEWSGDHSIVGIFGAINESTWEHLKLLFWPAFIFSVFEFVIIGRQYKNYTTAKAVSFYIGILLIISLFYTYTGVIGKHYLIIDILIFIISVIISQYIGYKITIADIELSLVISVISFVFIAILVFAFVYFTFYPPQIPLFKEP